MDLNHEDYVIIFKELIGDFLYHKFIICNAFFLAVLSRILLLFKEAQENPSLIKLFHWLNREDNSFDDINAIKQQQIHQSELPQQCPIIAIPEKRDQVVECAFEWVADISVNGHRFLGSLSHENSQHYHKLSLIPECGIIAQKFKHCCKKSNSKLYYHDGKSIKKIEKYAWLQVYPRKYSDFGTYKNNFKFAIIPNCATLDGYDLVIGTNILDKYRYFYDNEVYDDDGTSIVAYKVKRLGLSRDEGSFDFKRTTITSFAKFHKFECDPEIFRLINAYTRLFCKPDLHGIKTKPMEIITETDKPIVMRWQYGWKNCTRRYLDELYNLERMGIIERSLSPYLSHAKFKLKKDGSSLRLILTCGPLNDVTKKLAYPSPSEDQIFKIAKTKNVFSSLDCTWGSYQIKLNEADRHKTAFWTPIGKFHYIRCPYGTKNSTSYFQSQMDLIFADGLWTRCIVYIDDILVFGVDRAEHDENLKWVLEICMKFNIKLNLDKCHFAQREVKYCGYMLSSNPKPIKSKILELIEGKPALPESKTKLNTIVNKIYNQKKFLEDEKSEKCLIKIRKLLKTKGDLVWSDEDKECYQWIINTLVAASERSF